ncbi:MAG: hypothetical protein V1645_05045 [archaeon]
MATKNKEGPSKKLGEDISARLTQSSLKATSKIEKALLNYQKELGEITGNILPKGLDETLKEAYKKVMGTVIEANVSTLNYYNKTKGISKPRKPQFSEEVYGQDFTNH